MFHRSVLAIAVLVLGLLPLWLPAGSGASYTTPLQTGDSALYKVSGSYNETVDTTEMRVLSVQFSNLTASFRDHYYDGEEVVDAFWLDLATGRRNSSNLIFAIGAGLNSGDAVPNFGGPSVTVSREETHDCGGIVRRTNYATYNRVEIGIGTQTLQFYWEKATGVLCDFYLQDPGGNLNLKMLSTSIYFPGDGQNAPTDGQPSFSYLVLALIGILIVALFLLVWTRGRARRRRRARVG